LIYKGILTSHCGSPIKERRPNSKRRNFFQGGGAKRWEEGRGRVKNITKRGDTPPGGKVKRKSLFKGPITKPPTFMTHGPAATQLLSRRRGEVEENKGICGGGNVNVGHKKGPDQ